MSNYVEANLGRASFLSVKGYELAEIVPIGHKMTVWAEKAQAKPTLPSRL